MVATIEKPDVSLKPDAVAIDRMMEMDSCFWAIENKIKLIGGTVFTLDGCEYMADIMRDKARYRAVMKGTQARITTAFQTESIHSLRYNKYPQGIIYYFPTEKDVEKFSKTQGWVDTMAKAGKETERMVPLELFMKKKEMNMNKSY